MMFGKSEWFAEQGIGWVRKPACWQGWAYAGGCLAVVGLPFLLLLSRGLFVESLIWTVASTGAVAWDVRSMWRDQRSAVPDDVLYIDEDEATPDFASRNFDFRLRG